MTGKFNIIKLKIINSVLKYIVTFIILLLIQFKLTGCPRCNQDFYDQLMGERGNTLGGQELLEAIKNQQVDGQPSNFVLPASYNSQTDIKKSNIQDTAYIYETSSARSNQSSSQINYYSYIYIFTQLIFPGYLNA